MPTDTDFIMEYWGKAQPQPGVVSPSRHPCAYHNLDVAATGAALLNAKPLLLKRIAVLAGLPDEVARTWLLFALAVHDLGKFACCFQSVVPEQWAESNRAFWEARGNYPHELHHGAAGHLLWHDRVAEKVFNAAGLEWDARDGLGSWLETVFGHHGRPVEVDKHRDRRAAGIAAPRAINDAAAFAMAVLELFKLETRAAASPAPGAKSETASWLIAGLSVIADWIGSNQVWFPYTEPDLTLGEYWSLAQKRAKRAVREAGLLPVSISRRYDLSDAVNRGGAVPTPLQDWAASVPLEGNGPTLAFLEDLTGSGKTEAALILAHRIMARGDATGLYWALPTQATANALYRRLSASYRKLFGDEAAPSLALAHGAVDLHDDFQKSRFRDIIGESAGRREDPYDVGEGQETASASCAQWLASDRRRSLLADVGVGTVDQALLAALPVKFQSLRLTALSERVLIIDEAHSYDKYTTRLLKQTLAFQAALGGSAVVLSATLTTATKQELMQAFAEGAGWASLNQGSKVECKNGGFPLASLLSPDDGKWKHILNEKECGAVRGTRRDLPVARLETADDAVASLIEHVRAGRCAVWIRNTVQDAIDGADAINNAAPELAPWLFHARFTLADRAAIENKVIESFGKNSTPEQRAPGGLGRILVATQVIEQSLDLDFDAMVTDLAPIDLITQRAGRLHRHNRGERATPLLQIVAPAPQDDAATDWFSKPFPRGAYVYPHPGHLWRTMRLLQDAGALRLASENPRALLEAVFESEDFPTALLKAADEALAKNMSWQALAAAQVLDWRKGYILDRGWESDADKPTRLGEATRVVRLAKWNGSKLTPWADAGGDEPRAWRMSEVQLRAAKTEARGAYPPEIERAAKAVEASWLGRAQDALLLPLTLNQAVWSGSLAPKAIKPNQKSKQQPIPIIYDGDKGFQFLA